MMSCIHDQHSGAELELDDNARPGDTLHYRTNAGALTIVGMCISSTLGGLGQVHVLWCEGNSSRISADSALAQALIAVR